jgi:hypothetical protein
MHPISCSRVTVAALALAMAGCASVAVTEQALVDRTAFALGLNKGDFTITQRMDEGTTTRYSVRTRTGQEFNCFVGGTFSMLGRTVSEAVCSKKGEPAKSPFQR